MCQIIRKTKRESFTGYKVVAVDDKGDFYSTFTGQKYEIGIVPAPPERAKRLSSYWISSLDLTDRSFNDLSLYKSEYAGHTAVFVNKEACSSLEYSIFVNRYDTSKKIITVKMTISGNILECEYEDYSVYAGTVIDKIEIVK